MARVSLIMPVRNGAAFLEDALTALCAQTYRDFELIICDNDSTDRTGAIAQRFAQRDARIRYYRNAFDLGAAPNYNLGFALAEGEYVKWCAHDDLVAPDFLTGCIAALDRDPAAVLAYGTGRSIDAKGRPGAADMRLPDYAAAPPEKRFAMMMGILNDALIFGLWRAEALRGSGLHRRFYGSDRALLAEMALKGRFVHVPEVLFYNRDHAGRSIHIDDKRARAHWQSTDGANRFGLEHWTLLLTLIAIAWRARRTTQLHKSLGYLTLRALHPHQLARYGLELLALPAPGLQRHARNAMWAVIHAVRPPRTSRTPEATALTPPGADAAISDPAHAAHPFP